MHALGAQTGVAHYFNVFSFRKIADDYGNYGMFLPVNGCGSRLENNNKNIVCNYKLEAEIEFEYSLEYQTFSLNVESCGGHSHRLSYFEADRRCSKSLQADFCSAFT